ncbi:nitric oxide-sensing transcriptional repressor NsrR [Ramlibacter solisilvae]|uniref:BadM/Rrf2 family transcriptional regulator n=1 Tax=Ramlibacter tataouinensis TaxID=94132 RepID=A0A127JVL9_9BURK|nr:Rrf2 family transcriptional regulator [Ramlibacter tataouinensis]AMO24030.1 BadM/Rrf2 family transcriptional regulator [Ramlibacter tataouinensis]
MKLTTFTDYSLRVLIYLAARPEQRVTIAEVAQAFAVSEHHLVKVVHFLGQQGWLLNVRGKGGGLELGMVPDRIRVGQVVRQTEGEVRVAECFGDGESDCRIVSCCHLRGVLGEAVTAFYAVLDRYTLADLVANRQQLARVLFMERPAEPAKAKRAGSRA